MDDRGSGWSSRPGDQDRLARVEQELEALEDEVTQLRRILPGRLASGQRPAQGGWSNPDPTVDTPATSLRAKALQPRYRPDPIGRVEARVSALRWEVERLLRIVDLPGRAMAPGPRIAPRSKEASSAPSPRDTPPAANPEAMPPGEEADTEAGNDQLGSGLVPSKGPGGAGPYHKPPRRRGRGR